MTANPQTVDPAPAQPSSVMCPLESTMPRYLIMVRAEADSEANQPPAADVLQAMADFHAELSRAGVLLDAAGLQPSAQGWRVRHAGSQPPTVVDGPFAETKELIAGYTLIQARSHDEALAWSMRFPAPFAGGCGEIEVRPLQSLDDLPQGEAVERFRRLLPHAA
jgi:hypothetical protein